MSAGKAHELPNSVIPPRLLAGAALVVTGLALATLIVGIGPLGPAQRTLIGAIDRSPSPAEPLTVAADLANTDSVPLPSPAPEPSPTVVATPKPAVVSRPASRSGRPTPKPKRSPTPTPTPTSTPTPTPVDLDPSAALAVLPSTGIA